MKNKVYLSSGTFTGRINGRNPHFLSMYHSKFDTPDGFELMVFPDLYNGFEDTLDEYRREKVNIRTLHADKTVGDCFSQKGKDAENKMYELLVRNIEAAESFSCEGMVVHPWGIPDSDKEKEMIYERIGWVRERFSSYNTKLYFENCVCVNGSPLEHLEELAKIYPDILFTFDTRQSEFHKETLLGAESFIFDKNVAHVHISDYSGGYKTWDKMYPIPQPSGGTVDFDGFFQRLAKKNYHGTFTLESPAMQPDCVDVETLSRGVAFIKEKIEKYF